jgi:hypothetical protein
MTCDNCEDWGEHLSELRKNALPTNCTRCNGKGSEPLHGPENGPCERCGGWSSHKRLIHAEVTELRERLSRVEAVTKRDWRYVDMHLDAVAQEIVGEVRKALESP